MGRPPGAKRRTIERHAALAEAADKLRETVGEVFTGNAHALMTMHYQDMSLPFELRLEAAKASAPYELPKLSAVEHKQPSLDLSKLSTDELEFLDRLYRREGGPAPSGDTDRASLSSARRASS